MFSGHNVFNKETIKRIFWEGWGAGWGWGWGSCHAGMWDHSFPTRDPTCAPLQWKLEVLTTEPPGKS